MCFVSFNQACLPCRSIHPKWQYSLLASKTVLTSCILFTVLFWNPTLLTGMRWCYLQRIAPHWKGPLKLVYYNRYNVTSTTTNFIGEHDTIGHYATNWRFFYVNLYVYNHISKHFLGFFLTYPLFIPCSCGEGASFTKLAQATCQNFFLLRIETVICNHTCCGFLF